MARKEEEEEYEVQYINSHRIVYKGKDKKPKLEFEIKWRGYDSSENTWEPSESTEHAQDLVDQYWALKGGGAAERKKCERVLNGEKEESNSEDEEEEKSELEEEYKEEKVVEKKAQHKKRTTAPPATTTTRSKRARTGELPSTSTNTTTTTAAAPKKKSKRAIVQRISDDESDESDVSDSEIEKNNFRASSIHWTTDVDKILAVRPTGPSQELYATVRWRDGKVGLNKTALIAEKNPLLLIEFYEKRLAFESRPRQ